ncbi:MAG: hypothetical protein FWG90_06510 [Oscillospiraceae bacterium]|nr:hypothetical protein [Oscillospiraceae bacterium]
MHKDFHLYATYLAARMAKFTPTRAQQIALAAQAVDDYTYSEYACCQEMLDVVLTDMGVLKSYWSAFHFLPGGVFEKGFDSDEINFVTKPDSGMCQLLKANLREEAQKEEARNKPARWMAKAGVAMHVLADTHAHEGFAGIPTSLNIIKNVELPRGGSLGIISRSTRHMPVILTNLLLKAYEYLDSPGKPAIGHSTASHAPDISWLKYTYNNYKDEAFQRDNPSVFAKAFVDMYETLGGDPKRSEEVLAEIGSRLSHFGLSKRKDYSEKGDCAFASMLDKNALKIDSIADGESERANLDALHAKYLNELNTLSRNYKEASSRDAIATCFRKLMDNDFFVATIWHRNNVTLAMMGLGE